MSLVIFTSTPPTHHRLCFCPLLQLYWKNRSESLARCRSKLPASSRDSSTRSVESRPFPGQAEEASQSANSCEWSPAIAVLRLFFFLTCLANSLLSHLSSLSLAISRYTCLPPHHRTPSLTLLSPLLPQDPKERLGCHPQTGFADIMGHPFFRNVDWDLVRY